MKYKQEDWILGSNVTVKSAALLDKNEAKGKVTKKEGNVVTIRVKDSHVSSSTKFDALTGEALTFPALRAFPNEEALEAFNKQQLFFLKDFLNFMNY